MTKLFFGGIPTGPDVKRLCDAFKILTEGQEITHEQVQAVLNLDPRGSRYRSVTTAWRKELLNEENIEISALPGIGFKCLSGSERLTTNIKGFRQGTKKQAKSVRRVTMIRAETLSDAEQAKQLHMMRLGNQLLGQASSLMKQIDAPKPQEQIAALRQPPSSGSGGNRNG